MQFAYQLRYTCQPDLGMGAAPLTKLRISRASLPIPIGRGLL
jgi:hypothetical protein